MRRKWGVPRMRDEVLARMSSHDLILTYQSDNNGVTAIMVKARVLKMKAVDQSIEGETTCGSNLASSAPCGLEEPSLTHPIVSSDPLLPMMTAILGERLAFVDILMRRMSHCGPNRLTDRINSGQPVFVDAGGGSSAIAAARASRRMQILDAQPRCKIQCIQLELHSNLCRQNDTLGGLWSKS